MDSDRSSFTTFAAQAQVRHITTVLRRWNAAIVFSLIAGVLILSGGMVFSMYYLAVLGVSPGVIASVAAAESTAVFPFLLLLFTMFWRHRNDVVLCEVVLGSLQQIEVVSRNLPHTPENLAAWHAVCLDVLAQVQAGVAAPLEVKMPGRRSTATAPATIGLSLAGLAFGGSGDGDGSGTSSDQTSPAPTPDEGVGEDDSD
jgi:hypothetical protein